MLCGVEDDEEEKLRALVKDHCCSREQVVNTAPYEGSQGVGFIPTAVTVPVGGAVMFVMKVDSFVRF